MTGERKYCIVDAETTVVIYEGIKSRSEARRLKQQLEGAELFLHCQVETDIDHPDGAGLRVR